MKCPVCVEEGKRSRVHPRGSRRTLMHCSPYYDEDGKLHSHNRNTTTSSYSCSEGHRWSIKIKGRCPNCDFGKGPDKVIIHEPKEQT